MQLDAPLAADGLDAGVDEEDAGADRDEDAEEGEQGRLADQCLAGGEDAGEEGGLSFCGFEGDGVGGVEEDGRVAGEVVQVHFVEVGEGVRGGV